MSKMSQKELAQMDPVELYKLLLEQKIVRFPNNFLVKEDGRLNIDAGIKITKYLIEEKLNWNREDICKKLCKRTFVDNKLAGLLNGVFGGSIYKSLETAYPGKYHEWELQSTPKNYWNEETGILATKWLIEEKLKWTRKQVCNWINLRVFNTYGLGSMIGTLYQYRPYNAINAAYPNEYKPWDFYYMPRNYWNEETGIFATKWLIEEKKKWDRDAVCKNICRETFFNNGLSIMLKKLYSNSVYAAINAAYPNEYDPYELEKK